MFGKIVVGVDGSRHGARALTAAAELARATGDEVIVVHAQPILLGGRAGNFAPEPHQEAEAMVDRAVRTISDAGVEKVSGDLRRSLEGGVAHTLLNAAREHQAGLVVVGSRGRSDLAAMLLGSVAHAMVHLAHCPVLVVRDDVEPG